MRKKFAIETTRDFAEAVIPIILSRLPDLRVINSSKEYGVDGLGEVQNYKLAATAWESFSVCITLSEEPDRSRYGDVCFVYGGPSTVWSWVIGRIAARITDLVLHEDLRRRMAHPSSD